MPTPKTTEELQEESRLMSARADETIAPFANYHNPRIPTSQEYRAATSHIIAIAKGSINYKWKEMNPVLANHELIFKSIQRYNEALITHPNRADAFDKAVQADLLSDIYFLTGKAMRDISNGKEMRSLGDCILFPLIRSLHWASADEIGSRFKVDAQMKHDSDHADIYLQNITKTGLGNHGFTLDNLNPGVKPNLIYLQDEDQTEALRARFEGGLLKIWDPSTKSNVPLHTELWRSSGLKNNDDNTAHSPKLHKDRNGGELDLDPNNRKVMIKKNFGVAGYVMSIKREIYVRKHHLTTKPVGGFFYHSSYLAGNDIICSGCMRVDRGKVVWVDNMSGHYQPSLAKLIVVLQTLRAQGVDIDENVVAYDHGNRDYYSAKDLLDTPDLNIHNHQLPMHKQAQIINALSDYKKTEKAFRFGLRNISEQSTKAYDKMVNRTGASLVELALFYAYMPESSESAYFNFKQSKLTDNQFSYLIGLVRKHGLSKKDTLKDNSTLRKLLKKALGETMTAAGIG